MKRNLVVALAACAVGLFALTTFAQNPPLQAGPPVAAALPFPPLSPGDQKFLDDVLNYWEQRSKTVERYRCTFQRFEYDPVFGPRNIYKTYSEGIIRYEVPDKGLFKVEKIKHFTPPTQPGQQPTYTTREGEMGEYWICDGRYVYEHDHKNKRLIQRELPPHMRGKAIAEGPLPFLFGAEAEKVKQQYWIRPLDVPQEAQDAIWLEAYPKTRKGAANFQKVHVVIDRKDFLPKGLVIFDRNFDPQRNPARTTFTFEKREVNWSETLQQVNIFRRSFYQPGVPLGWKKVIEKYDAPPDAEQYAPAASAGRDPQASRVPDPNPRR
jgi:TIGR03009 family protein